MIKTNFSLYVLQNIFSLFSMIIMIVVVVGFAMCCRFLCYYVPIACLSFSVSPFFVISFYLECDSHQPYRNDSVELARRIPNSTIRPPVYCRAVALRTIKHTKQGSSRITFHSAQVHTRQMQLKQFCFAVFLSLFCSFVDKCEPFHSFFVRAQITIVCRLLVTLHVTF